MIAASAIALWAFVGVADRTRPMIALHILDAALARCWDATDVRTTVPDLLWTASEVDPAQALPRIRAASDRLAATPTAPSRRSPQGRLAPLAAPHSRELRDVLLRRAVLEARVALATPDLWKPPPADPRRGIPRTDPRRGAEADKRLLEFAVRLWEAVLSHADYPELARAAVQKLLVDAKSAGDYPSDARGSLSDFVARDLANLEPALLIASAPAVWPQARLAEFCGQHAYSRWSDRRKDGYTRSLIVYAVENGVRRENQLRLFGNYDPARAWEIVEAMPDEANNPGSPKGGLLGGMIDALAWRNPDTALVAAERQTNEYTRRQLIEQVSRVWAHKRPGQIMRAVRNQDNDYRKQSALSLADAEIAWRAAGNPPRDTAEKAAPPRARQWTAEERKQRGMPRLGNPEEHRILERPEDTSWLTGPSRRMFLRQAGGVSYYETGALAGVDRIIAGLTDPDEIDEVLCYTAENIGQWGAAGAAAALLERVRSPGRLIHAARFTAQNLARQAEGL